MSPSAGTVRAITPTVVNPLTTLSLSMIRPLNRDELPQRRRKGVQATLQNLSVVKEFTDMLDQVCKKGLSAYEIVGEIDMRSPELQAEVKRRKSFINAFRTTLRNKVKESGLKGKLDVIEFNKGERFFVVGREI